MPARKRTDDSAASQHDAGGTSSTAKPASQRRTKTARKPKRKNLPMFNVVLFDDNDHTFDYVVEMLARLFGHPADKGFKLAAEVDKSGRAIVMTTHKELAELKRDQIHAFGVDPRTATCKGSMTATVEPAQ